MILVYRGPGASPASLKHTIHSIEVLCPEQRVETISPKRLIQGGWEEGCSLLVLPGGLDIPYTKALNGAGNDRIRSYVEGGGAYLGICAGAYFAGRSVEFDKGTPEEIVGDRELAFFPGAVRGPCLAPFVNGSHQGSRAAKITWSLSSPFSKGDTFTTYYNGGGCFERADSYENVTILAHYQMPEETLPVIIECQVGRGKAILSGVHFEFDPALLDPKAPYLAPILPDLRQGDEGRKRLFQHIISQLV